MFRNWDTRGAEARSSLGLGLSHPGVEVALREVGLQGDRRSLTQHGPWALSEMAPHSCTFAWKIPWTEEPDRPWSTGSPGVGHG